MRKLTENDFKLHLKQMDEDGFTVIEDAIEPDLVRDLKDEIDAMAERRGLGYAKTSFEGKKTLRIYNLLAHGDVFARMPAHPHTLPIAKGVLGRGVQLSSLSAICIGPEESAQPLHADTQMIPLPRPHVPVSMNSMWALVDYTEENGATRYVPGSHKFDHQPVYGQEYETLAGEMPAGSVMFFNSALWHGGGTNNSDHMRYGIACYYCAGWIRAQENQQLGVPLETMKRFPREVQELCGYSVFEGIYGHIENHDPIELLGQERGGMMVWEASDKVLSQV